MHLPLIHSLVIDTKKNGHCDVVEALVRGCADVNKASNDGCTPLHIASQNGHCDVENGVTDLQFTRETGGKGAQEQ